VNLAFLLPAALAALATALLPLLIHLARRSEQRPTLFAALQWLRQKPKPRHRIRFDEWVLLALRVALVCLFALLLARPVLFGAQSDAPFVAVAPGVDVAKAQQVDVAKGARWHWLAPGFPALSKAPAASDVSVMSWLRELDAALPADVALTVIVPEQLDGVDAQVPKLSRRVAWRVVPGARGSVAAPQRGAVPALAVRYAPQRADAVRYMRAAMRAWQAKVEDIGPATQPLARGTRQLAWLSPGAVPVDELAWARDGGMLLLDSQASVANAPPMVPLWRDASGVTLVEGAAFGKGRVLRFTSPLAPAEMPVLLDGAFPRELRAVLVSPGPAPSRVFASMHAPTTGALSAPPAPRDLQPWLLWLIGLVFAIERWFATAARRGVST